MPKTNKERRMSEGQVPVAGVDAIADAAPARSDAPRGVDSVRLGRLRSQKRSDHKGLTSRTPMRNPSPPKR